MLYLCYIYHFQISPTKHDSTSEEKNMKKLIAFLLITRPLNVLIGFFSIFMGAFITGTISPIFNVFWASLSGGLIAGAANAINDYFDVEIDRINKPYRPIPSGKLSRQEVFIFSMLLFILGILTSSFVNWMVFVIALCSSILLFLYSAYLKRTVLWGNLCVSLVTALAFIYGGAAVDRFQAALIPALFSFLFHFGREIIKDIQDMTGDAADQAITFPIRYGKKLSLLFASVIYSSLILITLVPFFLKIYGIYYLIVVILGVDLVIIGVLFSIWHDQTPKNLGRMSNLLKADMLIGLIAIYCGRI